MERAERRDRNKGEGCACEGDKLKEGEEEKVSRSRNVPCEVATLKGQRLREHQRVREKKRGRRGLCLPCEDITYLV